MKSMVRAAALVAALIAAPASAEEVHCIALDMPEQDYFALSDVLFEGSDETPDSFETSSVKCMAENGWDDAHLEAAQQFALYAAGFDVAMSLLADDGVTMDQVDTLMLSIPGDVARRWGGDQGEWTADDEKLVADRMAAAGIESSDSRFGLLQLAAIAALGMKSAEEVFQL